MKKNLLVIGLLSLFSVSAFAQSSTDPLSALAGILALLSGIPYVGPILAFIAKWGGLVAGLFTALSIAVQSILTVPQLIAVWAGADQVAAKIKAFSDEVVPWFQYLSIFNVQKNVPPSTPK